MTDDETPTPLGDVSSWPVPDAELLDLGKELALLFERGVWVDNPEGGRTLRLPDSAGDPNFS